MSLQGDRSTPEPVHAPVQTCRMTWVMRFPPRAPGHLCITLLGFSEFCLLTKPSPQKRDRLVVAGEWEQGLRPPPDPVLGICRASLRDEFPHLEKKRQRGCPACRFPKADPAVESFPFPRFPWHQAADPGPPPDTGRMCQSPHGPPKVRLEKASPQPQCGFAKTLRFRAGKAAPSQGSGLRRRGKDLTALPSSVTEGRGQASGLGLRDRKGQSLDQL